MLPKSAGTDGDMAVSLTLISPRMPKMARRLSPASVTGRRHGADRYRLFKSTQTMLAAR